jgi:hypothetical protein
MLDPSKIQKTPPRWRLICQALFAWLFKWFCRLTGRWIVEVDQPLLLTPPQAALGIIESSPAGEKRGRLLTAHGRTIMTPEVMSSIIGASRLPLARYHACERGNTLLVNDAGAMIAWLDLLTAGSPSPSSHQPVPRLEISWVPDNYPALNVTKVDLSDEQLAKHIRERCCGWLVRKCQLGSELVDVDDNGEVL